MHENIKLSIRENVIIKLVAQAKCRKTIANELDMSIHTVDAHLRSIHLKTNTHTLPELIIWTLHRTDE